MKRPVHALLMVAVLAVTARGPGLAQAAPTPRDDAQGTLALELSQLVETWIHGDADAAAARLDSLRNDNRLRGELPRWLAGLRAALALDARDVPGALRALQPLLDQADNPRPYLRAAQLLLALDARPQALAVIRQGRARDAASPALRRYEAGLLWLGQNHESAVAAYIDAIAADGRENYPYVPPNFGDWARVRPWGAAALPAAGVAEPAKVSDFKDWDEPAPATNWQPEPFADLFEPGVWYGTDLPGLDRCVAEMAALPDMLARRRAEFSGLHTRAEQAQSALEAFRGGDAAQRKMLARAAVVARWHAAVAARVCAVADLAQGRAAEAETMLRMVLTVAPDDTALLDLHARALGALGKAEEARTGPLARLQGQGLTLWSSMLYAKGPQQQAVDRVLEPALRLYRANPQAGRQQLEAVRKSFGPEHLKREVPADLMGVWLFQKGERELALPYLADAGRLIGLESGKALPPDGVALEHALLLLRVPVGARPANDAPGAKKEEEEAEGEPEPAKPGQGQPAPGADESDPLALRVLPRAGLLVGSIPESRAVIWRIAEVDFWGGSWGAANHVRAARALPDGEKQLRELLYGWHVKLATELTPQQLDAALSPDHASSKALAEALKGFAEGLQQAKGGSNWRVMQTLRERAGFVMGMVEARAMLLRARLRREPPADMAALAVWVKQHAGLIDLRAQFKAAGNEITGRLAEERAAARVPEVPHSGLLLDAARALARNGDHVGAARLIWLNRDVALGVDTQSRRLFLAALLARKAGDPLLEAQCRMAALQTGDGRRDNTDPVLQVLEIPQLRAEIEEFGLKGDLEAYFETCIVPWADAATLTGALAVAPELKSARVTMLMRNSLRGGMDGIFRASIAEGSVNVIDQNWPKLIAPRESYQRCRRLALWVLCADLPFARGRAATIGMNSTTEMLRGWAMLQQLAETRAAADPAAKAESERLRLLLGRCSTPAEEVEYDDEEWWD